MKIHFPKTLENLILKYVKDTFYRGTRRESHAAGPFGKKDLRFFASGVAELSESFISEHRRPPDKYMSRPPLRAGYLLYFLPINFGKTLFTLQQFPPSFWKKQKFRILDLGSGPATASLAFLTFLSQNHPSAELEIHLVDSQKSILKDGESLLRSYADTLSPPVKLSIHSTSLPLTRFRPKGRFDTIFLNHVLNEMARMTAFDKADWLAPLVADHLEDNGLLALMEPALKRPTRDLMSLRDHLISALNISVLSPCLHQENCPMLAATKKDWCHFYIDWEEPKYLQDLDRLVENENRFLKLAFILLGSTSTYKDLISTPTERYRLVSNRMATRGKTEIVLCGPGGRIRGTLLDRDQGPANRDIQKVRRGALVDVPDYSASEFNPDAKWRMGKKSFLKKVKIF